ncbi:hypothetical protein KI387_006050, partial [Taxus chinensis]
LVAEFLSKDYNLATNELVKVKNVITGGSFRSRAWVDVVKTPPEKNVRPQSACYFKSTKDAEGVTHLQVPDGCLQRALEKTNLALVRKFLGSRPNVDTIRKWAIRRWKPKGDLIITTMAKEPATGNRRVERHSKLKERKKGFKVKRPPVFKKLWKPKKLIETQQEIDLGANEEENKRE